MKILVASATVFAINDDTKYGGMERIAWDFADELSRQGYDTTLFAPDDTVPPEGVRSMGIGFNASPNINKEADAYFQRCQVIFRCIVI